MTTDERDILNSVKIPPPVSKAFPELYWVDHKPALLSADGTLLGWNEVTLDKLRDVLETHSPVCWDCYIAQMFCRDHPDLVVIRPGAERQTLHTDRRNHAAYHMDAAMRHL